MSLALAVAIDLPLPVDDGLLAASCVVAGVLLNGVLTASWLPPVLERERPYAGPRTPFPPPCTIVCSPTTFWRSMV